MTAFSFELDLPPGINSDDTTFAGSGRWAEGNNVRFYEGRPQTIERFDEERSGFGGAVRSIYIYRTPSGSIARFYGTSTKLWVSTGPSPQEITPVPAPSGVESWSFQSWGSTMLISPTGGSLYAKTFPFGASAAAIIATAPAVITKLLVDPVRRQAIAFGCNEELSGTFNGRCIRGCNFEDYTNWTSTTSNNAFEDILGGTGSIVGAEFVGDYVGVWTDDALYLGEFVGDYGQTYRWSLVATGCGLANPAAITTVDGVAYWVGKDLRLRRWAPGGLPEVIPCPISRDIRANAYGLASGKAKVGLNRRYNEIWTFYQDMRDGSGGSAPTENSRYFAYSISESAAAQRHVWFQGQLARTAIHDCIHLNAMVTGDSSGTTWTHTDDFTTNTSSVSSYIQSADQYVDRGRLRVMVQRVKPDFESQGGNVSLTLYMRSYPQGSAVTKGPYTLAPGAEKVDFRAGGKLVAAGFAATTGAFRLGRPVFEGVTEGSR